MAPVAPAVAPVASAIVAVVGVVVWAGSPSDKMLLRIVGLGAAASLPYRPIAPGS
jgi:hypothetical protein